LSTPFFLNLKIIFSVELSIVLLYVYNDFRPEKRIYGGAVMPYVYDPADNLHGFYLLRTNALYRSIGHTDFAADMDDFARALIYGLWHCGQKLGDDHLLAINSIYSRTRPKPSMLYWELVSACGDFKGMEIPEFYRVLATLDKALGKHACRDIVSLIRELLVRLSDPLGETAAESAYISSVVAALGSVASSDNPLDTSLRIDPETGFSDSSATPEGDRAQTYNSDFVRSGKDKADDPKSPPEDLNDLLKELDSLIGLESIKRDVHSLINLMKVRKLRQDAGLPVTPMSLHMVFTGNPGTGKTTIARLLARLYRSIGVLSTGQMVEVDRSGLVAGYVGQTALKTAEAIKRAMGGVLFIDEAYSLAPEGAGGNDFGREAVEVLLKSMEDNRADMVVIAAGYDEPMQDFIRSNPGLESRFGKYFHFEDYNGEELWLIFKSMCDENKYEPDGEAEAFARQMFTEMYQTRDENFGNARDVRNIFEKAVSRHSDRVAALEKPTREDLITFRECDLKPDTLPV